MPRPCRWWIALALVLVGGATVARADAVVRLCAVDNQGPTLGLSMNLEKAMQIGGRITFSCGGRATIRITRSHEIVENTTIDGAGLITLDGDRLNRVGMFWGRDARRSLSLVGLRIQNGGSPKPNPFGLTGGVVYGFATLELLRTTITKSNFPIRLHGGAVQLRQSELSDNTGSAVSAPNIAILERSRIASNDQSLSSRGGRVVIEESDVVGNRAPGHVSACTLRVTRSNFTANTGGSNGGALFVECPATIEESEFRNNSATFGGALYFTGNARRVSLRALTFQDNVASFFGGAIYAEFWGADLEMVMKHVTFRTNRARQGGAVEFEASIGSRRFLAGASVAFVQNRAARDGGALHMTNAGMKLSRGIFVGNVAGAAGGAISAMQQARQTVELANSLLVKNEAATGGAFRGNSALFINTTIADNGSGAVTAASPPAPTGIAGLPTVFPIQFVNTIVANDFSSPCSAALGSVPYESLGNNLQFPGASCGNAIATSYPALGPYYVPLFFSQALNGGNEKVCAAAPVLRKDVYDVRRPLGKACAIGAAEGNVSHLVHRLRRREGIFAAMTARAGLPF